MNIGKKNFNVYLSSALYELGTKRMVEIYALGNSCGIAVKLGYMLEKMGHVRVKLDYYHKIMPGRKEVEPGKWVEDNTLPQHDVAGLVIIYQTQEAAQEQAKTQPTKIQDKGKKKE